MDVRQVLKGILCKLRTGTPWRDLPQRYGPFTTVDNRHSLWAQAEVCVKFFNASATQPPESMAFINSSIICAHQHAAGGKMDADNVRHRPAGDLRSKSAERDRYRGGLSTKINTVVDEAGRPICLSVSPGQASGKAAAPALIDSPTRSPCCGGPRLRRAGADLTDHSAGQ